MTGRNWRGLHGYSLDGWKIEILEKTSSGSRNRSDSSHRIEQSYICRTSNELPRFSEITERQHMSQSVDNHWNATATLTPLLYSIGEARKSARSFTSSTVGSCQQHNCTNTEQNRRQYHSNKFLRFQNLKFSRLGKVTHKIKTGYWYSKYATAENNRASFRPILLASLSEKLTKMRC